MSLRANRSVWLKMECAQPSASFKQRGVGRRIERAVAAGATRVISSSGGNAGFAAAVCARILGVPCEVIVPSRTPPSMRARIELEGASVFVHGEVWDDAHDYATRRAAEVDGVLVHPFDHPDVWSGNATLIHELYEDWSEDQPPACIVLSVGGGGLLAGVLDGLAKVGWRSTRVLASETHGAASLGRSLEAGRRITLQSIDSVALTLGAKQVAEGAFQRAVEWGVEAVQVSDAEALAAAARFTDEHRVLVEPACGAALAAVPTGAGSVVVVVCGGASV